MFKTKKTHGFTILELIVVMALVASILTIIMVSLSQVRMKARDSVRMLHMNEIVNALNLYNTDNGKFPPISVETTITSDDPVSLLLENDMAISEVPIDPLHPAYTYTYISDSNGTDYTIKFCLETDSIKGREIGCNNTIKP